MTTTTASGFSRTIDYDTGTYSDLETTRIEFIRQDGDDSFVYHYNWIDDTGVAPPMAQILDPWSHSVINSGNPATPPIDLINGTDFVERLIFAVEWGNGKTTYILETFQPVEGIETCFFIGGDAPPPINDLADLNAFLDNPTHYIQDGAFEGGEEISLAGFLNSSMTENDVVTAIDGLALYWDGGVGNDTITGGTTDDTLLGGTGRDVLASGGGSGTLMGGDGNDTVKGGNQDDSVSGGPGNDKVSGDSGSDQVLGEAGNDQIFGGTQNDALDGGDGNDLVQGDLGDDVLTGGKGVDTLVGSGDADTLTGGAGADVFRFVSVSDSTHLAIDSIEDFAKGSDDIDLSQIDAVAGTAGNQAFVFVGAGAFTAEGQIRATVVGSDTLIEVNTTGAGGAEMTILVAGVTGLAGSDFLL